LIAFVFSITFSMKASAMDSSTYTRSTEAQVWPALRNAAHTIPEAARSRSASAQTTAGSLPPSSRVTGVPWAEALAMTRRPVGTLPVNSTLRKRGSLTSEAATASDQAVTFRTPGGSPARVNRSPMARPMRVVAGAGLRTMVFPAMSAAAIPVMGIEKG
jgi:hypothetical protein